MKILGLIPARGGSKGVPRKNIKLLAGKPLLQYTAEAALKSTRLTRVILSTDDKEIADVGLSCGLEVPFLRPAELAEDTTPTLSVVQHALKYFIEKGESFDALCLLQPTNPLRNDRDIDLCIDTFYSGDYDSIFTIIPVPTEYNPNWVYLKHKDGLMELATGGTEPIKRRQDLPTAFIREGSIYITKANVILKDNSLYGKKVGGYAINVPMQINIDTLEDWKEAESFFQQRINN